MYCQVSAGLAAFLSGLEQQESEDTGEVVREEPLIKQEPIDDTDALDCPFAAQREIKEEPMDELEAMGEYSNIDYGVDGDVKEEPIADVSLDIPALLSLIVWTLWFRNCALHLRKKREIILCNFGQS